MGFPFMRIYAKIKDDESSAEFLYLFNLFSKKKSSLFGWLVNRVNSIVNKGERSTAINILDIFGFEDFPVSFCIKFNLCRVIS